MDKLFPASVTEKIILYEKMWFFSLSRHMIGFNPLNEKGKRFTYYAEVPRKKYGGLEIGDRIHATFFIKKKSGKCYLENISVLD